MASSRLFLKEHVIAAAAEWDKNPGVNGFKIGRLNAIVYKGKEYPPKAMAAIAYRISSNKILSKDDFAGIKKGKWLLELEKCGFPIVPRKSSIAKSLNRGSGNSDAENNNKEVTEIAVDISKILQRLGNKSKRTKIISTIMARIGQGDFRKILLIKWGNSCSVTGNSCLDLLRASHIQRWADCTGKDEILRLSPENGIILTANLDCLFESGLIGFSNSGKLVKSSRLTVDQAKICGIEKGMALKKTPSKEQAFLLNGHRTRHNLSNRPY